MSGLGISGSSARASFRAQTTRIPETRFVKRETEAAENIARQADLITAKAIKAAFPGLFARGSDTGGPETAPDFFSLGNSTALIEQEALSMFRKHRRSAWRGAFHMSLERAYWEGLYQLRKDVLRISATSGCAE